MIGYVKHFDSNKTMSFKVGDNKLFRPGEMGVGVTREVKNVYYDF